MWSIGPHRRRSQRQLAITPGRGSEGGAATHDHCRARTEVPQLWQSPQSAWFPRVRDRCDHTIDGRRPSSTVSHVPSRKPLPDCGRHLADDGAQDNYGRTQILWPTPVRIGGHCL